MDIGKIYDDTIADHYDRDEFGLLSGARNVCFEQLRTHLAAKPVTDTLDLAVGTGASLVPAHALFPGSALHGIDLSAKMLEIAKTKLAFNAIHDDVNNAGRHFAPASIDLMLMHFLTTFIDGPKVVKETSALLRPGGYYSIVSTTYEAFPVIREVATRVVSKEFVDQASPGPGNPDVVASFLRGAGLEIVAIEQFEKDIEFSSLLEVFDFGLKSGFFTHIIAKMDEGTLGELRSLEVAFPVVDHYKAAVVLARKP